MEESTPCPEPTTTRVHAEGQTYFSKPTILQLDSPLLYWNVIHPRQPCLAVTAAKFLCAPSTSEMLSNIIDVKWSRLTHENAEMLIFLKKNLPLILKHTTRQGQFKTSRTPKTSSRTYKMERSYIAVSTSQSYQSIKYDAEARLWCQYSASLCAAPVEIPVFTFRHHQPRCTA